jgi:hypothetical protein
MPMRKYRSRPTTCEAEQWFPGIRVEGVRFHNDDSPYVVAVSGMEPRVDEFGVVSYIVKTGKVIDINPGDYVIRDTMPGFYYTLEPKKFEQRWEPAE